MYLAISKAKQKLMEEELKKRKINYQKIETKSGFQLIFKDNHELAQTISEIYERVSKAVGEPLHTNDWFNQMNEIKKRYQVEKKASNNIIQGEKVVTQNGLIIDNNNDNITIPEEKRQADLAYDKSSLWEGSRHQLDVRDGKEDGIIEYNQKEDLLDGKDDGIYNEYE